MYPGVICSAVHAATRCAFAITTLHPGSNLKNLAYEEGKKRGSLQQLPGPTRPAPSNGGWLLGGAPRIHGELLMLGFYISERTISRRMKRAPRDPEPAKRWLAFLRNHREANRGRGP